MEIFITISANVYNKYTELSVQKQSDIISIVILFIFLLTRNSNKNIWKQKKNFQESG